MSISSISNSYSSSISSVSSLLSTYHSEVVTANNSSTSTSYGYSQDSVSISSEGQSYLSSTTPPDFSSMSTDDFRAHLEEMQATLAESGIESTLDISSLSDDEINSIKDSMGPQGKGGNNPPPPPPPSSTSADATSTSTDLLDILLEAIEEMNSDESTTESLFESLSSGTSYETIDEMLAIYQQQLA